MPLDDLDNLDSLDGLDNLDALDALDKLDGPQTPQPTGPRAAAGENGVEAGPLEQESQEELSELLQGFKQRARNEQERFDHATQSDFWVTAVFQTFEQAQAFRAAIGQPAQKYVDGYAVAKHLGIELPPADVSYNTGSRQDLKLIALITPGSGDADLSDVDDLSGLGDDEDGL